MLEDVKQSNAQDAIVMCLGQVGLLLADEKKLIRSADFSKQQFQADKTIIDSQENAFEVLTTYQLLEHSKVVGWAEGFGAGLRCAVGRA